MKTNSTTMHLSAAFLALAAGPKGGTIIDPDLGLAISTNGNALAMIPLPEKHGFSRRRITAAGKAGMDISAASGDETTTAWPISDIENAAGTPAYRITIDPTLLAKLAKALGSETTVVLELPAEGGKPIRVLTVGDSSGWLMPINGPEDGLTAVPPPSVQDSRNPISSIPAIQFNPDRQGIELAFHGKPAVEIREAMKDAGFRWHGKTKVWYAKDTPARRAFAEGIVAQAKAA